MEALLSLNANKSQALDRIYQRLFTALPATELHVLFQRCRTRIRTEERFQRVADGQYLEGYGMYHYGTAFTYSAEFKFEHVQMAVKLRRRDHLSEASAYMAYPDLSIWIGHPAPSQGEL